MINAVYQLIAPRMIDVTYQEMHLSGSQVLIRPLYLSICHADQRYYQGMRSEAALKAKLPMALIHECVAEVIYDPTGAFQVGDRVIPIPNSPTQTDDIIAENYLRSSFFRSSGYDGFLQDYVMLKPDRLVPTPKSVPLQVASFTELISVSRHTISRFDSIAHARRDRIGVWGDGNLGFFTALLLHYLYPETELYVFGTVAEKLAYFTFAQETFLVDKLEDSVMVDHAFECVGGSGSRSAINQIIDHINPEGTIAIMGVSENFVEINTRMMLEKGLRMFGSSRSGRKDFLQTVELLDRYEELGHYFENLVGAQVDVREISDIHNAFNLDFNRNFGKTVLKWEK